MDSKSCSPEINDVNIIKHFTGFFFGDSKSIGIKLIVLFLYMDDLGIIL